VIKAAKAILICALLLGWFTGAQAQVTLGSPANGASLSSAPSFAWSGPNYDAFMFISIFYDDLGYWSGYYPAKFWLLDPGFAMPSSWWDKIAEDTARLLGGAGLQHGHPEVRI
jgi:hypothetical protein